MSCWRALLTLPLLVASATSPSRAQAADFVFEPPAPAATESVKVRATFLSNCYAGLGRAEVAGRTIRITVFEGCACPEVVPFPVEAVTTVGPLDAATYEVDLVTAPDPRDAGCDFPPVDQGNARLTVGGGALEVELAPPAPTPADEVTLRVLSGCPAAFDLPSRAGSSIRVTEVPSFVLAPCSTEPVWSADLPLGKLPAGDYTVVVLFDDGQGQPRITHTSSFRVSPGAGPELLLHEGRFRITALWQRRTFTGPAQALALLPDTGVFAFPKPVHIELLVRLVDSCRRDGHYWVFAGGATHAGVELTVEDTSTGEARTYSSPLGTAFAPVFDTRSFPCGLEPDP